MLVVVTVIQSLWQSFRLGPFPVLGGPIIQAAIILVAFIFGSKLVTLILERYVIHLAKKTKSDIDDRLVAAAKGPLTWFIILIGLKSALLPLDLGEQFRQGLQKGFSSVMVVIVAYSLTTLLVILISAWGRKFSSRTKSDLDDQLVSLFSKSVRVVGYLLGGLFILQVWGIQVGPLLATLGVGGIAIAFALQSSLGNIFGGIGLILDKTVKVGDRIELDDGTVGVVHDVGLRSTRIKTFNNEIVVIPNGKLADMKIRNFVFTNGHETHVRASIDFGVEYGSDIDHVEKIVLDALAGHPDVLAEPKPGCVFVKMGDFALDMRASYWVNDITKRDPSRPLATKLVYNALQAAAIGIPFPTRTVYMKKEK